MTSAPAQTAVGTVKRTGSCFDAEHKGKKRKTHNDSDETFDTLLGLASETRAEHLQRHGGGRKTCMRCRFYLFGDAWTATYGSYAAQSPGKARGRTIWLSEKPLRWGGPWRLGCCLCSEFEMKRPGIVRARECPGSASTPSKRTGDVSTLSENPPPLQKRRTMGLRGGTKWARYEVCHPNLGSSHIRDHAGTEVHQLAVKAHLMPDKPVQLLLQADRTDDQLMSGAVPQPADWLRAWRVCMNPVSWTQASNHAQTEHYIAQIREHAVKPRALQSMVSCMQEALRVKKRKWLREAKYIFLAFDDKNGRKLLRFKCDAPAPQTCFDAVDSEKSDSTWLPYGARIGVVGCMPMGLTYNLEDYERDYAERTCEEIVKLLERLLTPVGETLDTTFFDDVVKKVVGVVADGALMKTARYMKAHKFTNMIIIMRDPAHIIRVSCRDPLQDANVFAEQYDRLFGERHAVLKDFMNSGMWQNQLENAQKKVALAGASTPSLTSVLRHVDFVQPRFESFVSPRRRYVCLLRAIAMVLATKAGDERLDSKVQRRAEAALKAMSQAKDCFVAGLAGDYGEVCLEFLRYFDVRDHDPARAAQEVREFVMALQQLFVQGYVLCETETDLPVLGRRKTLCQIAVENMEEPLILT